MFPKIEEIFLIDIPFFVENLTTLENILFRNQKLSLRISVSHLNFLIKMIKKYGRRAKFLKVFEILLQTFDKLNLKKQKEIETKFINTLFNKKNFIFVSVSTIFIN